MFGLFSNIFFRLKIAEIVSIDIEQCGPCILSVLVIDFVELLHSTYDFIFIITDFIQNALYTLYPCFFGDELYFSYLIVRFVLCLFELHNAAGASSHAVRGDEISLS
jgi:hypothetical protein